MPAPVSQPADWSAYADVPLLHTIASAVIGLADVEGLASFPPPLPGRSAARPGPPGPRLPAARS